MKNSDKKVLISLIVMLISSLIFVLPAFSNKPQYELLYWIIFGFCSIFMIGFQFDRTRYKIDYIQNMIICILIFMIIYYLGGLSFGFSLVPYSLKITKILQNVFCPLTLICLQEFLRHQFIKERGKFKSIFILICIAFSIIQILSQYGDYDLKTAMGIFEFIGRLTIPTIANNVLLTYLTANCGIYPSIIYRVVSELYIYLVPITPDYGIYIESTIRIILPTIIYLRFNIFLDKKIYKAKKEKHILKYFISIPLFTVLAAIIIMVSGVFKYHAIAVGSGSMYPGIKKGDVVVVEKLKKSEQKTISIGDVLVFINDEKIIVHRVVKIKERNGIMTYKTKGDFNDRVDDFKISSNDIIGIVRYRIPYIGYPSVWLSEKLSG